MCSGLKLYKNTSGKRGWAGVASALSNPITPGAPVAAQAQQGASATSGAYQAASASSGAGRANTGVFAFNRKRTGLNVL